MPHSLHRYGFSPECVLRWQSSLPFSEKALLHWLHWYGFSPVCVLWCTSRWPFTVKDLLHCLHWYDLSPVCALRYLLNTPTPFKGKPCHIDYIGIFSPLCVLRCVSWLLLSEKAMLHLLHWYGLSQVCVLRCLLSIPLREKALSHWYGFSPLCVLRYVSWLPLSEKVMLHWLHWYGLSQVRESLVTLVWGFTTVCP